MKKTWLFPSFLLSFSLFFPLNTAYAAEPLFVQQAHDLTNEAKTSYFKVTVNITDQAPTQTAYEAFKAVKVAYQTNSPTSEINVPSNQVLMALYYMMENYRDPYGFSMNDRETFKNIKIEVKSATPVTLTETFPIGIYKNTWLKLDDTITIDGTNTSPMLTNTKYRNTTPYATLGYKPYNYNSNIVVEGGTWDSNRDERKVESEGFTIGNASNIFIRDVVIKDIAGGHAIDAAGVNGLVVENSRFLGSAKTGNVAIDRDYNEAIQLDQMASSGPFGSTSSSWGYFDGSVTKNVYIDNNFFGASDGSQTDTIPWQIGIGSHSIVKGVPYENITISNNTFDSMNNAGIRMTNYKNVLVHTNTFKNNDHGIKIYSTDYAFDYSNKVAETKINYPAVNDTITIQNNAFDGFQSYAVHINSYVNKTSHGLTKNVKVLNNTYPNSNLLTIFYQYFAQNTQLSDLHYDVNGYVISKTDAINHTKAINDKGLLDANYKVIFSDQLYRVSIPTRFTSKGVADYTAYLIKKGTGADAYVNAEKGGKYYVYTNHVIGAKRAKEIESFIENKMQYRYGAYSYNANHPNNLYRVGLVTRFNTYTAAKKASDDIYKVSKATSLITKEKTGKYYVRTNSVVGQTRANQVKTLISKYYSSYKPFSYNTNQMAYYQITVHPFFDKANADKQALNLKNTYHWIESIPTLSTY